MSERVYSELLARARVVLESGRSVVLDATFGKRTRREAARQLARASGAAFTFVECQANEAVTRARLAARALGPSISDGRIEIYADLARHHEPVTELPRSEHVTIDTSGTLEHGLAQLARAGLVSSPAGRHALLEHIS